MDNKMFCNQCQETAGNTGCTIAGVCGKTAEVAALQDILIYVTRGLAQVAVRLRDTGKQVGGEIAQMAEMNLFITITNANFDGDAIAARALETVRTKDVLLSTLGSAEVLSDAARWSPKDAAALSERYEAASLLQTADDDVRSLRSLILYGLKGMAAYAEHAAALGEQSETIGAFLLDALAKTLDDTLSVEALIALTLETGKYGVDVMALLDKANTGAYGNPKVTSVNLGVRGNPGILVSGHDLHDLEMLLAQTEGTGVDVYTHSEMLPAHYYPAFQKYSHLAGNYGNAWWKQREEFESFHGPVLLTTNCLVPPKESYRDRIYTTGAVGFPGCPHIPGELGERKDFSAIIEHAKRCAPPAEIETGEIIGGFAHHQVLALADQVVAAVKSGAIRKFVVMAGCDGRAKSREYYTDFAKALPQDTVILTAGCAKYKYNKLGLGDIGGIPRVLDAGQCNDSYSLAVIALKLKEVFALADINELPIVYNIAWYEQKAVIVLLALLHLGVKNIHLGPTLPAFLSPNVAKVLVENFGIAGIETVERDIEQFFGEQQNGKIDGNMRIGDILRMDARFGDILMSCGMHCLGCPSAQGEALADACAVHGVDTGEVLEKLNALLAQ